jgi:type III secretion system YscQ/HrcQ family protein
VKPISPGDPELERLQVRPFQPRELEHISGPYRDIYRVLNRILPEEAFAPGFLNKIRKEMRRYTGMETDLWLNSVRVLRRTHLRSVMPGVTCLAIVGLAPLDEKILVEIDQRFVYRAVNALLGGHGLAVDIHRPLTEIEQGVFSFILLKILALFSGDVVDPELVGLRLEDVRNDLRSTADILRHHEHWLSIAWKMNFDLDVGYVRALVPDSLARRMVQSSPDRESRGGALHRHYVRSRLGRLQGATVDAKVAVGRIELSRGDIDALDTGDIVLLEDSRIRLHRGSVGGPASLVIGAGKRGQLHGEVKTVDDRIVFEIQHFDLRQAPSEKTTPIHEDNDAMKSMNPDDLDEAEEDYGVEDENEDDDAYEEDDAYADGGYSEDQGYDEDGGAGPDGLPVEEDNLIEAEPLMGDIVVPVVVELGRVRVSAEDVIRFRPGQLIELGRSPADPVDLVVNEKLLAKGELVEIEGALGVRILSILKDRNG